MSSGLAELAFVKLGGSLITNKAADGVALPAVIQRLALEMRQALLVRPSLRLVLGHGSGSFGHRVAARYGVQGGVSDWCGYALTGAAATRLNRIVTDICLQVGLPVVSLQPSASARCHAGSLVHLDTAVAAELLRHRLVPLVFGDVALDDVWGTTIASTEMVFDYLARELKPNLVLLLGEVDGVYTADPRRDPEARLIPVVNAATLSDLGAGLGGSDQVDVTGGMRSKVLGMARLVSAVPGLQARICSGLQRGLLLNCLTDPQFGAGTFIVP